ncbi:hypothetical protein RDV78_09705 [Bacillota bacterium LX-D]|nr:hypothetical protein [Bacillota bacterium LX-D]
MKNESTKKYINLAEGIVEKAVTSTTQTYVDTLKKNNQFDANAQIQAFDMAKEKAIGLLSQEIKGVLAEVYGDVDSWLDMQIEQQVRKLKVA